jgi:predicted RNase H-like HicB family nuclease
MGYMGYTVSTNRSRLVRTVTMAKVLKTLTLEYWLDDGWYVGRLREAPGVFSQGETLEELEENIRDAYTLMRGEEAEPPAPEVRTKEIAIEV